VIAVIAHRPSSLGHAAGICTFRSRPATRLDEQHPGGGSSGKRPETTAPAEPALLTMQPKAIISSPSRHVPADHQVPVTGLRISNRSSVSTHSPPINIE
jgi:hypothetical protein